MKAVAYLVKEYAVLFAQLCYVVLYLLINSHPNILTALAFGCLGLTTIDKFSTKK